MAAHFLITGGGGYVGSHALRALRHRGHSAVVIDDLRSGRAAFAAGVPLERCDVADRGALDRIFATWGPFDGVLHCAGSIQVAESVADPLLYYQNNVGASIALIQGALRHGVRVFAFSSSAAVYGAPQRQPIPETEPLDPGNPYAASKAMVERMLADAQRAHGLRWVALRYFNAAGADPSGELGECHDPETHLVPLALEAAAGLRQSLAVCGNDYPTPDGTCVRDYVHVSDLAHAHVLSLEALLGGRASGPYNVGNGRGYSVRDVLEAVRRVVGRPVPARDGARRPGDPPVLVADAGRLEALGWQPRYPDLDTIVAHAWRWLRHRVESDPPRSTLR